MVKVTPDYYSEFRCIAERCNHSCCISWEIDIDDDTLSKYEALKGDFGRHIKENISLENSPHFKLDKDERCPFLNDRGLCDIITNFGENMLCQICKDHPRFRNFYSDYVEVGLGLCCEAACEIILTKKEKTQLVLSGEIKQNSITKTRKKLFDILQDRSISIERRVDKMLEKVGVKLPENIDWYSVFFDLERLDISWEKHLLKIKNGMEYDSKNTSLDTAYEQLLVYLIFRHFADCQYDDMVGERVLFAALIYKLIRSMNTSKTIEELLEICRLFSCEIEYSEENIYELLSVLSQ